MEDLTRVLFSDTAGGRRSVTSLAGANQQPTTGNAANRKLKEGTQLPEGAIEALEGFVVGLYQEAFNALVYLINR